MHMSSDPFHEQFKSLSDRLDAVERNYAEAFDQAAKLFQQSHNALTKWLTVFSLVFGVVFAVSAVAIGYQSYVTWEFRRDTMDEFRDTMEREKTEASRIMRVLPYGARVDSAVAKLTYGDDGQADVAIWQDLSPLLNEPTITSSPAYFDILLEFRKVLPALGSELQQNMRPEAFRDSYRGVISIYVRLLDSRIDQVISEVRRTAPPPESLRAWAKAVSPAISNDGNRSQFEREAQRTVTGLGESLRVGIRMSLAIDPIVSNVLFSLSLLPHFTRVVRSAVSTQSPEASGLPFISVVLAFYDEPAEDIDMTIKSLLSQSYPVERYEIVCALEPDDEFGIRRVGHWLKALGDTGVAARIVLSEGAVRSKPHALNGALPKVRGKYCAFYDAGDVIDCDQLEKAIRIMEEAECDVCQARVLRDGPSLLSRLLLLDTCVWYWKYVPVMWRLCGGFPLSGEGLFVRTSVLQETGGFPEVLTEDALLGLILTSRQKRFALVDSIVMEKAPRHLKAHFNQKMRWHRGYLTCLGRLWTTELPLGKKLLFALIFSAPIVSILAFLGWLMIAATLIGLLSSPDGLTSSEWLRGGLTANGFSFWSFILVSIGIPLVVSSSIHASWSAKMPRAAPFALLLPLYWIFVAMCSIAALFRGTVHWARTERWIGVPLD